MPLGHELKKSVLLYQPNEQVTDCFFCPSIWGKAVYKHDAVYILSLYYASCSVLLVNPCLLTGQDFEPVCHRQRRYSRLF